MVALSLRDAVESLQRGLADTPRRGRWLDIAGMTPEQAVDAILAGGLAASRWDAA